MKTLLVLAMFAAIGILLMDDRSKRAMIDQAEAQGEAKAEAQIQALKVERDELREQVARLSALPNVSPTPGWFQQRQQQPSALDAPGTPAQ